MKFPSPNPHAEAPVVRRVRNWECLPHVEAEGLFVRPVETEAPDPKRLCSGPSHLHRHHTLSSIRRHRFFRRRDGLAPDDSLDLALASTYDHTAEAFADPEDVRLQPETLGRSTWRRLRNTRDVTPEREEAVSVEGGKEEVPRRHNFAHKVVIGGVAGRESPDHVKLMVSSAHGPLSKDGYVRQAGGGYYCY